MVGWVKKNNPKKTKQSGLVVRMGHGKSAVHFTFPSECQRLFLLTLTQLFPRLII